MIPGEAATPAEPELRIACEGGEERLRRINATIRTRGEDSELLPVPSEHSDPRGPRRRRESLGARGRSEAAHGRNDAVLAEAEG